MTVTTGKQFRAALPGRVRALLPDELRGFRHRQRFSFVQFWYEERNCHFEVAPVPRVGVMEIGLHFEMRPSRRNERLHAFFDQHYVELRHELGEIWLEKWDRGWHKLYATIPYESHFDDALLAAASAKLAAQIITLQPMVRDFLRAEQKR